MAGYPVPEAAKQLRLITRTMFDCRHDVSFFFKKKKNALVLQQMHWNYTFGIVPEDVLWQMCDGPFVFFLLSWVFRPEALLCDIFAKCFFPPLNVESWTLNFRKWMRCYSWFFCEILDESCFLRNFSLSSKVSSLLTVFVDNGSHRGQLERLTLKKYLRAFSLIQLRHFCLSSVLKFLQAEDFCVAFWDVFGLFWCRRTGSV